MQFVKPVPFDEAVTKLGRKTLIGSKLSSSEWRDVPAALRERAFFSAQVESLRFLQRARDGIAEFLQSSRDDAGALATGSRAQFVKQMQEFLASEGVERTSGGLQDLAGEKRLGLIFDTQTRQANDYGYWREGQDADVLDAFPAQRFIRVIDVKEPRNEHTQYEGLVALKSDPVWTRINEDFGVPWGPWGWGCGHDVEDVSREEAESLGLIAPGQPVVPAEKNFNENLKASTRGLDADLLAKLRAEFGDQVIIDGDEMRWRGEGDIVVKDAPRRPRPTPPAPPAAREPVVEDPERVVVELRTHETRLARRRASEKLVALDAAGNVVLEKTGGRSSVTITGEQMRRLKDSVLTHNHPVGLSFSNADIATTVKADLREIRAVGVGQPYTYSLKRPEGGWPRNLAQRHQQIQDELVLDLLKQVRAGTLPDVELAERELAHQVMVKLSAELNLKYERTRRTT